MSNVKMMYLKKNYNDCFLFFLDYHKNMVVGTKAQVWHGTADKTSGGLTRDKLVQNEKTGCIVSKAKHELGKKQMKKMMSGPYADVFLANQEKISGKKEEAAKKIQRLFRRSQQKKRSKK